MSISIVPVGLHISIFHVFRDDVPFSAQLQSESQQSHHPNPHYQHHQEPEITADILL